MGGVGLKAGMPRRPILAGNTDGGGGEEVLGALAGRVSCPQGALYLHWQFIVTRSNDRE